MSKFYIRRQFFAGGFQIFYLAFLGSWFLCRCFLILCLIFQFLPDFVSSGFCVFYAFIQFVYCSGISQIDNWQIENNQQQNEERSFKFYQWHNLIFGLFFLCPKRPLPQTGPATSPDRSKPLASTKGHCPASLFQRNSKRLP